MAYQYIGEEGDFCLKNPEKTSYLYFPLANENGVKSCVTPDLGGDLKTGQNSFFMAPVSSENLHNDKSTRNFWCILDGKEPWSLTGRSGEQQSRLFSREKEETTLEAGIMHHKLTRISKEHELKAEITNFVPFTGEQAEVIKVSVENRGRKARYIKLISAIPIYGRSADNIRDHRHVTSLLHRIQVREFGVAVNPTMTFNERGHEVNHLIYGVFGGLGEEKPVGFFPVLEEFIGEGGNLENPEAVFCGKTGVKAGYHTAGYEALGGLEFAEKEVMPGEKITCIFVMAYGENIEEMEKTAKKFLDESYFDHSLEETAACWQEKVNIKYHTGDRDFDHWMRWVSFQPMLRRIYGCSFLPHHDYGRGGRGWRDLWQDCLALLLMNPDGVRKMIVDNICGVRLDGTNATIIGSRQGEFFADRNNIVRVWMDHGIWPYLTIDLYIRQTGDLKVLLEDCTYFKDMQVCRGDGRDTAWREEQGEWQRSADGEVYRGSILEHLLIEHLTSFYDVGEHNHIRIRGADWNDALDMAAERGESVAFTAMYGKNMEQISNLLSEFVKAGIESVPLMEEIEILLSPKEDIFWDVSAKRQVLERFCKSCEHCNSGKKVMAGIEDLQKKLEKMYGFIFRHIRQAEWIEEKGLGWYNGYYDNSGRAVEGIFEGEVRMMLTGQVFCLMSGTAEENQIPRMMKAMDTYLFDKSVGGYRLNTDFHEIKMDLGRMFGFAYGHKENGAVFSHMTTMFANALYQRGAAEEGYHVIETLFRHCNDFERSKIYPGIPEYFDAKGRGMYHYLTGAASWMLFTVVTEMFGIQGDLGNLVFGPKLCKTQFDASGEASVEFTFAHRKLHVTYVNKKRLGPKEYQVEEIWVNGKKADIREICGIKREELMGFPEEKVIEIKVILEEG